MTMTLPAARGPVTSALFAALLGEDSALDETATAEAAASSGDLLADDDVQLALWVSYALHYTSIESVPDEREWDPAVLGLRRALEQPFLHALRDATSDTVAAAERVEGDVADKVFVMADEFDGPPLSAYLQRKATSEQFLEFLAHRSAYNVRESDPQAFVLPRLTGAPKTAMAELLYDEFGAGRPEREHGSLFASGLAAVGLDPSFGALVGSLPGSSLALTNAMNLFNLHRGLLPAAVGHFAGFEATSSEPSRKLAGGARRLGLPTPVVSYYEEHVEADAVHEQLMARAVCGDLVAADPSLEREVLFGAATCLLLDARAHAPLLEAWQRGESSLRPRQDERLAS